MVYVHLTDQDQFRLASYQDGNANEPGLFVYRYYPDRLALLERAWEGRRPVLIDFPGRAVLIQRDPLGNDRARDEWLIPATQFHRCRVIGA